MKMKTKTKTKYYAVLRGNKTGIFSTWSECQEAIKDCKDCKYKAFFTNNAAEKWLESQGEIVVFDDEDTIPWKHEACDQILNPSASNRKDPELEKSFANIYIATTIVNDKTTKKGACAVMIRFLNGKDDAIVCKNNDIVCKADDIMFCKSFDSQVFDLRLKNRAVIEALTSIKDKNQKEPVSIYVGSVHFMNHFTPEKIEESEERYKTIEKKYEDDIVTHDLSCLLKERPVRFCSKEHYKDIDIFKILNEKARKTIDNILNNVPYCPICGSPMRLCHRHNDGGAFWGCSQFKNTGCRGIRNIPES
jgi:hypothetical protein